MTDKNTTPKKTSPAKKLLIASALLIAVALAQHLIFDLIGVEAGQDLRMVDTDISISYGFDMSASFYSPGNRHFFFAARDGVQKLSSTGELRWQHGFNLSQPNMVGSGEMVAIGEPGGHKIYVFGPAGYLYSVDNLPYPALYFTVNSTGYLSVIMRSSTGYIIRAYDPRDHDTFHFHQAINNPNVFPFSVDVSNCGTYIAKALLDVDTLLLSRITFSYKRRVDSRGAQDGFFRSYRFDNELVARVRFTDDGRLIAVTDQQIVGFMAGEGNVGTLWNIPLHNRPDKLIIGDNHLAFVTGEAFLNDPDAEAPGILHIYNFNGNLTGTYDLGRRATHLSMSHNTVLAGTDRTFYAINQHGTLLWEYQAIQDVRDMIFLENTDTILLAGGNTATIMRRLRAGN